MLSRAIILAHLLPVVALLCIGCTHVDDSQEIRSPVVMHSPPPVRPVVTQYLDTASIDARVAEIDAYLKAHPDRVTLYAGVEGQDALVPVKDSTAWPDETSTSFNLGVDSAGRPIRHVAVPTSQSGDWSEVSTHWFAPDGRTILYLYTISAFSSGCAEVLHEEWRVYLNPAGGRLAESRSYTGNNGKPVVAADCHRRSDDAEGPSPSARDLPMPPH
jgi:hypothetical protein